jgi:phosphoadenosine phosphosulfate reductase
VNTNLFGETPESRSIAIIREFEPPEGYWGAFSGGKDSVVLKEVTRRAGVQVEWHYSVTTIDPPEVVKFIGREHPDVAFDKPAKSFTNYIRANWGLPMRQARWCCAELKERGGQGRIVLTGVRADESAGRSRYGVVQPCLRGGGKTLVHPLLHWTTGQVWDYIRGYGLPYCELYDQGWSRVGCVFCPFECNVRRAEARWPRMFARLKQAVADAYPTQACWQKYGSPEAVMDWWLDRRRHQADGDAQEVFAFDQFGGAVVRK